MLLLYLIACTLVVFLPCGIAFSNGCNGLRVMRRAQKLVTMEYIPDGMTKAQWEVIKKKEAEANKGKDLGAVGITKFKSRSFESWQKAGQKHLFPVDPKTPIVEKPYMQRTGGSFDGEDLKKKGLKGVGQAIFAEKSAIDEKYEKLGKEGKLKSTTFSTPWTAAQAAKIGEETKKERASASGLGKKVAAAPQSIPEPKKKLFGLF